MKNSTLALASCFALVLSAAAPSFADSVAVAEKVHNEGDDKGKWDRVSSREKCTTWIGPTGGNGYACIDGNFKCSTKRNQHGWGIGCEDSGGNSHGDTAGSPI